MEEAPTPQPEPTTHSNPRTLTLATAATAGGLTLLIIKLPSLQLAYRAPSLHVALETAAGLTGLLGALLLFGRYSLSGLLSDLVLASGLGTIAVTNLLFAAVPAALDIAHAEGRWTWCAAAGSLVGTFLFAAGAYVPPRQLGRPRAAAWLALAACVGTLLIVLAAVWALHPLLPTVPSAARLPTRPQVAAHPAFQILQLEAAMAFATAAIAFTRHARRGADDLMLWLGIAATLSAVARFNYFLYPSRFSEWVYSGDGFRLASYVVLAVGATREIVRYWRETSRAAVLEERRRIARDLHDGLAQELSYIARRAPALVADPDASSAAQISAAADRALAESRRAIAALTRPIDEPVDVALAHAVESICSRYGVDVALRLDAHVQLPSQKREAMVRIASEAVVNAVKHATPASIAVELRQGRPVVLRVVDDGIGFRQPGDRPGGFGLVGMRERARAAGGQLTIESQPGSGTCVEVTL